MIKLLKRSESSFFIMPFSTDMGLDFSVFLTTWKKSKKSKIYIYIYSSDERWAERWPDRKKADVLLNHHTKGRSNKPSRPWFFLKRLSSDCHFTISSSPNFFEFLSSSSEPKVTYVYAMLCYSIVIFYLLFWWLMIKFAPLARAQLHSPVANQYVFTIILSKGQW